MSNLHVNGNARVDEHRVITDVVRRAATRIGVRAAIISSATSFVSAALVLAVWRLVSSSPARSMAEDVAIALVVAVIGAAILHGKPAEHVFVLSGGV